MGLVEIEIQHKIRVTVRRRGKKHQLTEYFLKRVTDSTYEKTWFCLKRKGRSWYIVPQSEYEELLRAGSPLIDNLIEKMLKKLNAQHLFLPY
jgi:hypothetical protein